MSAELLLLCCLGLLTPSAIWGMPMDNECIDTMSCTEILTQLYSQLLTIPNQIHERSIAPWTYQKKIDPYRVPPTIYEAKCLTSHSCMGPDGSTSLETIPISVKIPVLKENMYKKCTSLEFETITIACLCAVPRNSDLRF
uniref:Interleukin-17A-like n=1 Tax=Scleropages formosus TaxID=113540 RepID=A0A8C9S3F7_SCLFO